MPRLAKYEIEAISNKVRSDLQDHVLEERQNDKYKKKLEKNLKAIRSENSELESMLDELNDLQDKLSNIKEELRRRFDDSVYYNQYSSDKLDHFYSKTEKDAYSEADAEFGLVVPSQSKLKDDIALASVEGLDDIVERVMQNYK